MSEIFIASNDDYEKVLSSGIKKTLTFLAIWDNNK